MLCGSSHWGTGERGISFLISSNAKIKEKLLLLISSHSLCNKRTRYFRVVSLLLFCLLREQQLLSRSSFQNGKELRESGTKIDCNVLVSVRQ